MKKAIGRGTRSNILQSLFTFKVTVYFPILMTFAQNVELHVLALILVEHVEIAETGRMQNIL